MSSGTNADDKTLLFEIVFVIVWIGAAVISINGSLLGGKMYNFYFYNDYIIDHSFKVFVYLVIVSFP